jgi:DNA-binding CsgD family transcriptional regulator
VNFVTLLVRAMSAPTERERTLTLRERSFLQALADGDDYITIATKQHIAYRSLKNYMARLFGKMGADSRTHAVAMGLRRGLIQ